MLWILHATLSLSGPPCNKKAVTDYINVSVLQEKYMQNQASGLFCCQALVCQPLAYSYEEYWLIGYEKILRCLVHFSQLGSRGVMPALWGLFFGDCGLQLELWEETVYLWMSTLFF